MSGIIGVFYRDSTSISPEILDLSMDTLAFWGGDAQHTIIGQHVAVGQHTRGVWHYTGNCGLYVDNNDIVAVDGVIHNREEICKQLNIERSLWHKVSDEELILLSYRRWAHCCVEYLIGEFAFFIWDKRNEQFFVHEIMLVHVRYTTI